MSYADAINQALKERADQLRDYGGFLAQAGIPLSEAECDSFDDWKLVKQGHTRQRLDYPEWTLRQS